MLWRKKCIAVISIINEWIQLLYTTYIHAKNYYTNTYIHIRHNIGKKYEKKKYRKLFQIQGPLPRKLVFITYREVLIVTGFYFFDSWASPNFTRQFEFFYIKLIFSIKLLRIILKSNRYFDSIWFSLGSLMWMFLQF